MNYRHAYHAGNFADVLKHAVLVWIVRYLQQKVAPLALFDTHAGAGLYDLTSTPAQKTLEAKDGILRLEGRADLPQALKPYMDLVQAANGGGTIAKYPGSASLMTALAPGPEPVFTPGPPITKAAAPQLVATPRLADRPSRLIPRPSQDDRRRLTQLAALAGTPEPTAGPALVKAPALALRPTVVRKGHERAENLDDGARPGPFPRLVFLTAQGAESLKGWSTGFAPSPEWDEDHPDEASYRPFPLAPFLTQTASVDDPALIRLVHPDFARTGELFEISGAAEPMRLRPGRNLSELMWSETWGNGSIGLDRLGATAPGPVAARRVQTEAAR